MQPVQCLERQVERLDGRRGLGVGHHPERPGLRQAVEARVRAVGQAALDAKLAVEHGRESPAEHGIDQVLGVTGRVEPRAAHVPQPEVGLRGTGLVYQQHAPSLDALGRCDLRRRPADRLPGAEMALEAPPHLGGREVPDHRHQQPVASGLLCEEAANVVEPDRLQRRLVAVDRPSVRMLPEQPGISVHPDQLAGVRVLGGHDRLDGPGA